MLLCIKNPDVQYLMLKVNRGAMGLMQVMPSVQLNSYTSNKEVKK